MEELLKETPDIFQDHSKDLDYLRVSNGISQYIYK